MAEGCARRNAAWPPADLRLPTADVFAFIDAERATYNVAQGVRQSACTSGPGDHAHMESFFHSMKAEDTRGRHFATDAELRTVLLEYIRYYNTTRAHSALAYRSPIDFERRAAELKVSTRVEQDPSHG